MRWLAVAAVVLALTTVAEIAVFVLVAKAIGVLWAVVAAVLTTVLGGWLLRREGGRGWRRLRAALADGRAPGVEASDGLIGLAGALLLVLPGFVTDLAGLILLVPPVRRLGRRSVQRATERRVSSVVAGGVFGPRRVRAYRGPATPDPTPTGPSQPGATDRLGPPAGTSDAGTAIEGTIVGPDPAQPGPEPRPDRRP